jgi:RNA polymerase sigma factor (sigma-70 family)
VTTMDWLAAEFQAHRAHLRAVSYRMLGSLAEADDAVQETWLRLTSTSTSTSTSTGTGTGTGTGDVRNLRAWLTTVVSRICLDMLRARTARRENPLDVHVPDPVVTSATDDPEQHALLADSVGLALLVVLDTLSPAERLAFVLHDVFAVPFDQIGSVLDRSPAAAKQLATRARHRLRAATAPAADPARQREVAEAFLAASRGDDFEGLLAVLHPAVVLRADAGAGPLGPSRLVSGAPAVAAQAHRYARLARFARPVLVNGTPGYLVAPDGQPFAVIGITVRDDKITEIDILADPERLSQLDLAGLIH